MTQPANSRQVGGNHYRKLDGEQHWDRQWRLFGHGYFVGNITAYVERYRDKNGVEDLEKARHYLDKLIELEKVRYEAEKSTAGKVGKFEAVPGELTEVKLPCTICNGRGMNGGYLCVCCQGTGKVSAIQKPL